MCEEDDGVMKNILVIFFIALLCSGCTHTYPYLVLSDHCNCEIYTYRNTRDKIEIEFRASYTLSERVTSSVQLLFRNNSDDTLSLRQAYLTGTSRNVRYQYNGKRRPLPYELIPPHSSYSLAFEGTDTEAVENPWLKIVGERVVLEVTGLILGEKFLPPVSVELMPVNPKLSG